MDSRQMNLGKGNYNEAPSDYDNFGYVKDTGTKFGKVYKISPAQPNTYTKPEGKTSKAKSIPLKRIKTRWMVILIVVLSIALIVSIVFNIILSRRNSGSNSSDDHKSDNPLNDKDASMNNVNKHAECATMAINIKTNDDVTVSGSIESDITTDVLPTTRRPLPRDCQAVYDNGERIDGTFDLDPTGSLPIKAYCVFDSLMGVGWTRIQQRVDGTQSFTKSWQDYKMGFGDPENNVWLGNEHSYQMIKLRPHKLRIILRTWDDQELTANYDHFSITDESNKYAISFNYTGGNLEDSLGSSDIYRTHYMQQFSTYDADNDKVDSLNCSTAKGGGGGWWYNSCWRSNLNGLYFYKAVYTGIMRFDWPFITWDDYRPFYTYKYTAMLITPM